MNAELTERQRIEKLYHDEKFRDHSATSAQRRVERAFRHFWQVVGEPHDQTILDFGCGDGWVSIALARQGNRVHGFDISESLLAIARQKAAALQIEDRVSFREMPAENLEYPAESFDLIIGTSILHHTELDPTLKNIGQVLKKDGTAVFLEPLNENIGLRIWRWLTPSRRSVTERALTAADIARIRAIFPSTRFSYFCFSSMVTEGLLLMFPRSRFFKFVNDRLAALDEHLLRAVPALGQFSAVVVMEMRK